jgi:hypothetical protein
MGEAYPSDYSISFPYFYPIKPKLFLYYMPIFLCISPLIPIVGGIKTIDSSGNISSLANYVSNEVYLFLLSTTSILVNVNKSLSKNNIYIN